MFDFFKDSFDYKTFLLAVVLGTVGVMAVNSATYNSGMHEFFVRDIIWQISGLVIALAIMFSSNRFLQNGAYFFYAVTILLLLFVLIAGEKSLKSCKLDRPFWRRRPAIGACESRVDSIAFEIPFGERQ